MNLAGIAFRLSINSVVNTPPVLRSPISTLSDSDDPTYHGLIDSILISQLLLSNPARHIPDIHFFALKCMSGIWRAGVLSNRGNPPALYLTYLSSRCSGVVFLLMLLRSIISYELSCFVPARKCWGFIQGGLSHV